MGFKVASILYLFIDTATVQILDSRPTAGGALRFLPFAAGRGQKGRDWERKGRDYKGGEACDIHISASRGLRKKRKSLAESP